MSRKTVFTCLTHLPLSPKPLHSRLEIHAIYIVEINFWLLQTVEYFLVKEVNYVVTDRSLYTSTSVGAGCGSVSGNTPKCTLLSSTSTPLGGHYSESPATLDSPGDGLRGGRRSVSCFLALCFEMTLFSMQLTFPTNSYAHLIIEAVLPSCRLTSCTMWYIIYVHKLVL